MKYLIAAVMLAGVMLTAGHALAKGPSQAAPQGVLAAPLSAGHVGTVLPVNGETTVCGSSRTAMTDTEQSMFDATNALRASHGVAPLAFDPTLERSADTHSIQMAATGVFAHDSYGATLARTQSCGSPTQSIDENIAGNGSGDPTATFQQYVNSPPHLQNLLDPNMLAVGISTEEGIYNDGTTIWQNFFMNTMTFASATTSQPQPKPTPQPTPQPGGLHAVLNGPTSAVVGQSATFSVTGTGATSPYFAISYGDASGIQSWQTGSTFSHAYSAQGTYTVSGWIGDGATGQFSSPASQNITVGVASTPTPKPNVCNQAYFLNTALTRGPQIQCP